MLIIYEAQTIKSFIDLALFIHVTDGQEILSLLKMMTDGYGFALIFDLQRKSWFLLMIHDFRLQKFINKLAEIKQNKSKTLSKHFDDWQVWNHWLTFDF